MWNQDQYIKAWNFASTVHNVQQVPGTDIPYINHIGLVAMEVMAAVAHNAVDNPTLGVQCALLHDTIEDCEVTFEQIQTMFAQQVGDGVQALSKNKNKGDKAAQMHTA